MDAYVFVGCLKQDSDKVSFKFRSQGDPFHQRGLCEYARELVIDAQKENTVVDPDNDLHDEE